MVSIDKYGLDALGRDSPNNTNADPLTTPQDYTWFWNNDHWLNYLEFVKSLNQLTKKHIVLWQIPVGHINNSQTISEYTRSIFKKLDNTSMKYEDSATTFFFGDEVVMESPERMTYFSQNKHGDSKLKVNQTENKITFQDHIVETMNAGVHLVLFGAGVGFSTDGVGAPPTDDYFWIQKVQQYYKNGVVQLSDVDQDGVNDFDDQCPNTPIGTQVDKVGCPVTLYSSGKKSFDFLLYPNPTKQRLLLETKRLDEPLFITVFSITGEIIYRAKHTANNQNTTAVYVADLPKGTYLLNVKTTAQSKAYKFIKE